MAFFIKLFWQNKSIYNKKLIKENINNGRKKD